MAPRKTNSITPLVAATSTLIATFGDPPTPARTDPFGLVIWESAAYLVDEDRRRRVFERLGKEVGIDAERILDTPIDELTEVVREDGGMQPRARAEKLHAASRVALEIGVDRLRNIGSEPIPNARRALRLFRGFGEPGADKILMFAGALRSIAPDSNVLRVLNRLGYGTADEANYTRSYRATATAVEAELPPAGRALPIMHLALRRHGQTVCRRTGPSCEVCPLTAQCAEYAKYSR